MRFLKNFILLLLLISVIPSRPNGPFTKENIVKAAFAFARKPWSGYPVRELDRTRNAIAHYAYSFLFRIDDKSRRGDGTAVFDFMGGYATLEAAKIYSARICANEFAPTKV